MKLRAALAEVSIPEQHMRDRMVGSGRTPLGGTFIIPTTKHQARAQAEPQRL